MEFQICDHVLIKYNGDETQVIVPEEVTEIGDDAFQEHIHIETVILPNQLTRIGKWAFSRCSSLKEIAIPEGVTTIGVSAFRSCTRLSAVSLPDSVKQINGKAFEFCKTLRSVKIPGGLSVIAEKTFSNCAGLGEVILEEGVKEIGAWAFEGCSTLRSLKLPNSLETVGESAFLECVDLSDIEFGNGMKEIKYNAFGESAWLEKQRGDYVKINHILIKYNGDSKNITIPADISVIGCGAFEYCHTLETAHLHRKVNRIDEKAFYECVNLSTVYIPAAVTMIHRNSFYACKKLNRVFVTGYLEREDTSVDGWELYHRIYSARKPEFYMALPTAENKLRFQDIITCNSEGIQINFVVYDREFAKLNELGDKAVMAVTRLLFPIGLSEEEYIMYYNYLLDHGEEVTELFVNSGLITGLRVIAELFLLPFDYIDDFIQLSADIKNVEITSYLLGYKNEVIGYKSEEYEL